MPRGTRAPTCWIHICPGTIARRCPPCRKDHTCSPQSFPPGMYSHSHRREDPSRNFLLPAAVAIRVPKGNLSLSSRVFWAYFHSPLLIRQPHSIPCRSAVCILHPVRCCLPCVPFE